MRTRTSTHRAGPNVPNSDDESLELAGTGHVRYATDSLHVDAPVRMPNTLGATPGIEAVGLAWGCVGALAAPDNRFADFLAANPPLEDTVCAYTTTTTSSEYPGETRVERFSPGNGWQLLTVNGEPPSARALKDYAKGRR